MFSAHIGDKLWAVFSHRPMANVIVSSVGRKWVYFCIEGNIPNKNHRFEKKTGMIDGGGRVWISRESREQFHYRNARED